MNPLKKQDNHLRKEIGWLLKEKYKGIESPAFEKDVARLNKGEPLDYIIGFTEFLGCKIDLSKKPLIPRPETEFWAAAAIKNIKPGGRVLDMFAGSGCVGISIALSRRSFSEGGCDIHVTFADKQKNCIRQIAINAKLNGVDKKRYTIIQSDIFSKVKGKFDCIVANPPYIPTAARAKVQPSALAHEPSQALFGGVDGLAHIRRFLAAAKNHLNLGGAIYLEFDPPQKPAIAALLKKHGYASWQFHKDQYGRWRWVVINNEPSIARRQM